MYNLSVDNSKDRDFKGFFWGYVIIAFVAIFGGAYSIYSRINGVAPFLFGLDPTPGPVITESQERLQELAQKKLLDSDGDTISDFDEEFTYNTSSYLADSDSDGIQDNVELDQGSDPNCATGTVCFGTTASNSNNSNTNGSTNVNAADIANLSTDDPNELRQQLIALGIDETVLSQVSDSDLLAAYGSVQQDYTNGNTNTNSTDPYANLLPENGNTNSTSSIKTYEDLQNLSPEAVRDLLIQSGMSADELSQVDDATLMQVYQDALEKQTQ